MPRHWPGKEMRLPVLVRQLGSLTAAAEAGGLVVAQPNKAVPAMSTLAIRM
jgi:hypothetical protein